ncbi:hypothetical protein F4802DRAFT_615118 [Xylaria palmicola]|nr:hypothetical protein F4802DRAFT_615118 [Xylaria palmicola]
MPQSEPNRPPPLPPRSPRPPVTDYFSSEFTVQGFPPPPPRLPPRASAGPSTPVGPPPPLPPRPSGYDITSPIDHGRVTANFPLPPPPPLGPPPPYTPSLVDPSHSPSYQPHWEPLSGPHAAQSYSLSPTTGVSVPTTWTTLPPPPPGPPPQPSPRLSPGISQESYTPPGPPSPSGVLIGSSISQPIPRPTKHQANPLGVPETRVPASHEKAPSYQPSLDTSQTSPVASNFTALEKPLVGTNSSSRPPAGESVNQLTDFNSKPAHDIHDGISSPISTSTPYTPLESQFQSLNIATPPIPPKTPLESNTAHYRPSEPPVFTPGSVPAQKHYVQRAEAYLAYKPPNKAASPAPDARPSPASRPAPHQDAVPQASPAAAAPPRTPAPSAVTTCIDAPVTFATDWYWHPEAPDFLVCSRCYVDHIHGTRHQLAFRNARPADGRPRVCRFSKPRMRGHLYPAALASGSLRDAAAWMRRRAAVPDCRGVEGIRGDTLASAGGVRWFAPREAREIPGFLACEACYEDRIAPGGLAARFALFPTPQTADTVWACDLAVPFVEREHDRRAPAGDWRGFVAEVRARMAAPPCPGSDSVAAYGRDWFVPVPAISAARPRDLVLCAACYRDHVVHSGEEPKWEVAQGLARSVGGRVRCAHGSAFNVRILMARAHEAKDWALFWDALGRMAREKACEAGGVVDGAWYTLPSHPRDFAVCAACRAAILEPLGVARLWVRGRDAPRGEKRLCCFNMAHPRLGQFVPRLLEMYFTRDASALEAYASVYASIPQCNRDEDKPNRRWHGWKECTICPECYFDFAQHSPLAKLMEFHDSLSVENTICDMYSKRMRALYTECGNANPPDPKPLLEYSVQRMNVYLQTVPQIRMIIAQQRMALEQHNILNAVSSHYKVAGQLEQITGQLEPVTYGTPYTYSAPGVGHGFANMNALQGAAYEQQALDVAAGIGGSHILAVQQLEQRWKAVE